MVACFRMVGVEPGNNTGPIETGALVNPATCPSPVAYSQIFTEIGAIQSLKRIVCYSSNGTTSTLAQKALRMMDEKVPRRLLPTVPNWKPLEVQNWLQQIGFAKYCPHFLV